MRFMFGIDKEQPMRAARALMALGFDAAVLSPDARLIDGCLEAGLKAYACVGAFGMAHGGAPAKDIWDEDAVWFGSGCPYDEERFKNSIENAARAACIAGVSGVFVDGARFASPASPEGDSAFFTCFCPRCLQKAEGAGIDLRRVKADLRKFARGGRWPNIAAWLEYRQLIVGEYMRAFIKAVKPKQACAFVFPHTLSSLVGQTAPALKGLDIVSPMLYRRYPEAQGPACLNHEYAALERVTRGNALALTGVDAGENILREGFPPSHVARETLEAVKNGEDNIMPILQLNDEQALACERQALAAGAKGAGYFAYDAALIERVL